MNFKITKPVRLLETFSGIGSQAMALRDLGVNFEHWRTMEWDVNSVKSYHAIHMTNDDKDYSAKFSKEQLINILEDIGISSDGKTPMMKDKIKKKNEKWLRDTFNDFMATKNIGSVMNRKGKDLKIVDTDKYCYILTYSFPCFTKDTLVLTKNGYKKIIDVKKDDYVLTHNNTYRKVLDSKETGEREIYKINAMGVDEIECTDNHKFYVREMYRSTDSGERYNSGALKQKRCFKDPKWIECKDLTKNHYLGVAINQESIIPEWNGVNFEWSDGRKTRYKNEISKLLNNHSFWWIVGRYLGDGWIRSQGGIIICCDKKETIEILPHIRNCGFGYSIAKENTVNKIHIPLKELSLFFEQFGRGAGNKHLPGFIFDLPSDLLRSMLDGYVSADGCFSQDKYKISSISKELIYGMAQIVAKAYNRPYSIYKVNRPNKHIIDGRIVNQNDCYQLTWKPDNKIQDKAFYDNGYIWFPINNIEKTNRIDKVYDITVEDDHSFVANGVIVHNCQDLSLSGLQKGMSKGSGTRSGLLWEIERLLNECAELGELPQVLLMENVTQLHSKKNIADFEQWIGALEKLGYSNFYQDMNSKNYGVAQNRDRCFMVSILKSEFGENATYTFPEPIPLQKRLKDYLEDEVDEKYYINTDRAKELIGKLIDKDVLPKEKNTPIDLATRNPDTRDVANCVKTIQRGIVNFAQAETGVATYNG